VESKAQPGMSWRGFGAFVHSALAKGRKANSIALLRHREGYYAASFRIVRGALPEYWAGPSLAIVVESEP
jgi:hypothetical protein